MTRLLGMEHDGAPLVLLQNAAKPVQTLLRISGSAESEREFARQVELHSQNVAFGCELSAAATAILEHDSGSF